MNYYPRMNHHHMAEESQFHYSPQTFVNVPNRFIYVKQSFLQPNPAPVPAPKVLINPHFKKKVFMNPQFSPLKPKIHVNPNMFKNFSTNVPQLNSEMETKSTVISTRNKLVRVPCGSRLTENKVVKKRRNSLHTKYKIVRSSSANKNTSINKFKLDKRVPEQVPSNLKSIRKKYVYVNRFLSINVMAKNVLLKKNLNLNKPGFVNINGILYKKSPNSLKKASESSTSKSKFKLVRKETKQSKRSLVKRYKLIRSRKQQMHSRLRKCNIPCSIYRKFGRCKGKDEGTCFKLHNPNQIVLCTRFLQGACLEKNCLLSHKVSHEKMPTCKYYLEGLCSRDDCPYLHVKISIKAEICREFLKGYCKKGAQCDKRHQFLCPDFEKNKTCLKKRCPYPHGNMVRNCKILKNSLAKKSSMKNEKASKNFVEIVDLPETNRYYKDCDMAESDPVIGAVSKINRPKLGDLPAFIPFFEDT